MEIFSCSDLVVTNCKACGCNNIIRREPAKYERGDPPIAARPAGLDLLVTPRNQPRNPQLENPTSQPNTARRPPSSRRVLSSQYNEPLGFEQVAPPDVALANKEPLPAAIGSKQPPAEFNDAPHPDYNRPTDHIQNVESYPALSASCGNQSIIAQVSVPEQKSAPAKESMAKSAPAVTEDEPEPEEQHEVIYDAKREFLKCTACAVSVWVLIVGILAFIFALRFDFEEEECYEDMELLKLGKKIPKVCESCGTGTLVLPLGGEWEKTWNKVLQTVLYFLGLGWCFLGVGICCDQFMAAIEEITSTEKLVWTKIDGGSKHKFHIRVWNDTVANLTLMALGSSAPEILLSVIELMVGDYFSGELGPSTIVGSASFNLLVITAVCVSAIPAPDLRKIDQTGVFAVTASVSILAYVWLLFMLQWHTPDMVDIWEAVLTFLMFPGLVLVAFAADRGYIQKICSRKQVGSEDDSLLAEQQNLQVKYGKTIRASSVKKLLEAQSTFGKATCDKKPEKRKSRASYRAGVMTSLAGGSKDKDQRLDEILFGFKDPKHFILECAGFVELKVVASQQPRVPVSMRYCTRDGRARAGVRYEHQEGILFYEPHETEKIIQIPIIDNQTCEGEEDFIVELACIEMSQGEKQVGRQSLLGQAVRKSIGGNQAPSPKPGKIRFGLPWTSVWILDDDDPGMLSFVADEVMACEGASSLTIGISRTNGSTGAIHCQYKTHDDSAQSGYDFAHVEGKLDFDHEQSQATIEVPILRTQASPIERRFRIILNEASPGVKFDPSTDGGETSAICDVLLARTGTTSCSQNCAAKCSPSRYRLSFADWKEQFPAAFYCNGDAQEQSGASMSDWFAHGLALFFKTIFAITPPPRLGGGWPCFVWSLVMIGCVTAVVGDMAKLLGCCLGIPDGITAITLVALGTSLPDTFASKTAAEQDDNADNSIGNVTGSNSVNVFLGLGLPWSCGAIVWSSRGATVEWQERIYKGKTYKDHGFVDQYPEGGFLVPAGSLAFSVAVFVACAFVCLGLLLFRRLRYGGELGGPSMAQKRDMILLICLWTAYIAASCVYAMSVEEE